MDLHSYAKHKNVKKWSIEQKRRLIDARLLNEDIFQLYPSASRLPWRRVINDAKLHDFNESFVKRQWSCTVSRYKQYKTNHSRGTQPLSPETIRKINEEWEFFEQIHNYMTQKTTNLHSYAANSVKNEAITNYRLRNVPDLIKKNPIATSTKERNLNHLKKNEIDGENNKRTASSAFSDTNDGGGAAVMESFAKDIKEEIESSDDAEILQKNLNAFLDNHNYASNQCYRKRNSEVHETNANSAEDYIVDHLPNGDLHKSNVNQSEESSKVTVTAFEGADSTESFISDLQCRGGAEEIYEEHEHEHDATKQKPMLKSPKRKLTERDKYYRHKRHFNRRMERRFDAILDVAAQIAKAEYPSIDVSNLLRNTSDTVRNTFNCIFSSDEDLDNSTSSEEGDNNSKNKKNVKNNNLS